MVRSGATKIHHARIMCEGGCQVEDIALTLGMLLHEVVLAVGPALKCNARERARVQKIVAKYRIKTHVIHKRNAAVDDVDEVSPVKKRRAA